MISGDVGDHGHVGAVVAQAAPDDAAAGRLQDRRLHRGVVQDHLRGPRARRVGLVDQLPAAVDPVGGGHPDAQPGLAEDVRDHPHRGGLPVGAGHGHDRDARGCARRVEPVHDRARDVARAARGGLEVHPQPGARVELDHRAGLLAGRERDVGQPDVDAAHVQGGRGRGPAAHRRDLGMHEVGDVRAGAAGGQVGVPAQRHGLARPGTDPGAGPAPRGGSGRGRPARSGSAAARAPRPGAGRIGLPDQGLDVLAAVSGHRRRMQPGGGHHVPVHDEDPVVDPRTYSSTTTSAPLVLASGTPRRPGPGTSPPP